MRLILRKSSSLSSNIALGMGVTNSVTHCLGYSPVLVIVLKIRARGFSSSDKNYFFNFFGISPGIEEFFIFLFLRFSYTSYSSIVGVLLAVVKILALTLSGRLVDIPD